MIAEAAYSESHQFAMSGDMSNLVRDRYDLARQQHPEMMLPELTNPNLSWQEMQRRDQGVAFVMDDLMGDLRSRRIDELGDVPGVGTMGPLGLVSDLGRPSGGVSGPDRAGVVDDLGGGLISAAATPDREFDGNGLARSLGMSVKPGSNISSLHGDLAPAMSVVNEEARALGLPQLVVTSGNDSSRHMAGSAHYDDRALDFRGNNISDAQGAAWAEKVRERLGPEYVANFERFPDEPGRDHLHVARRRDW